MPYEWMAERDENATLAQLVDTPHPALEPVSAWLFREDSPFLGAGGLRPAETSLYSMAIAHGGFSADADDAFRARRIPGRGGAEHFFHDAVLQPLLNAISDSIENPSVHVLPMPTEAVLTDDELRARQAIGSAIVMPRPAEPSPPPKAIIGIIDHGINIFHHRFRSGPTGSRVEFAWMMGAVPRRGRLPFGAEWNRAQIEQAQAEPGGDEDALLRRIGADFTRPGFRPLAGQASHGTHVLDLAAGMDPEDPAGAEFPIIAVTLPPEVTRETSGSMLALPFVLGLEYILDRARLLMRNLAEPPPVYVNFSFGLSGGPRQGLHRLERTIHRLAERHMAQTGSDSPPVVVVAAGNRNLGQGHAAAAPGADSLAVTWHIQPGDPTGNFLELRVETEPGALTALDLAITPPGQADPVEAQMAFAAGGDAPDTLLLSGPGGVVARASAQVVSDRVALLTLALAPSDPGPDGEIAAPSGDWQVTVTTPGVTPDRLDAFILRDDVPYGFRDGGRQSYFVDPAYDTRDETGRIVTDDPEDAQGTVRRAGTLNAIATGGAAPPQRVRVVGGYVGPDAEGAIHAAPYSATPLPGTSERVDVSAQSDRSRVLSGVLAAGTRSGTRVRINGTSVAAPQLVRHLAFGAGRLTDPPGDAPDRLGAMILIADPPG